MRKLNTFRAALLAVMFSTVIGIGVGLARLSSNLLLAKIASAYVELLRNIPLVVQLFFWYAVIAESFPAPAQAMCWLGPTPCSTCGTNAVRAPNS
jgi:general L-amino acid transport system permease protein